MDPRSQKKDSESHEVCTWYFILPSPDATQVGGKHNNELKDLSTCSLGDRFSKQQYYHFHNTL